MNWLIKELQEANDNKNIAGVFLVHSWSWKGKREWRRNVPGTKEKDINNTDKVQSEKKRLTEFILSLDFNKQLGGRFLVMISGDMHMLAYDQGAAATNDISESLPDAPFPIF